MVAQSQQDASRQRQSSRLVPDEHTARRGIRAKLARAFEHVYRLERELVAFHRQETTFIRFDLEDGGRVLVGRLHELIAIPDHWAVILGEIAYNLRSALDQSVYQVGLATSVDRASLRSSFPIYTERRDYENRGHKAIESLSESARQFVDVLQPFELTTVAQRNLAFLNKLSNQDKHRIIELFGYAPIEELEVGPQWSEVVWSTHDLLRDGAEVVRLLYSTPISQEEVKFGAPANVKIIVMGPEGAGGSALADLCDCVSAIVSIMLTFAAHPDQAIFPTSAGA